MTCQTGQWKENMSLCHRFLRMTSIIHFLPLIVQAVNPACECVQFSSDFRTHGLFTSPNYPQIYQTNVNCILYTFTGDVNEIVELVFKDFDLQLSITNKCTDYLRFYLDVERPEVNEQTAWNYDLCGSLSMIPERHYSSKNNLVLEFHSDSVQSNNTGFRGFYSFLPKSQFKMEGAVKRFSSPCAYDFHSTWRNKVGRLFSPRYPQNYPPNANCQYFFHGLPHETVNVKFDKIQLANTSGSCSDSPDFIVVRDGLDVTSTVIAQYCNFLMGEKVVSSGPSLYIDFIVDGRDQRQGFEATYEFVPSATKTASGAPQHAESSRPNPVVDQPTVVIESTQQQQETDPYFYPEPSCDQNFVSSVHKKGTFKSPNHPEPHRGDIECKYKFSGHGRERVQIVFTDIDLHYTPPSAAYDMSHLLLTPPTEVKQTSESILSCDDVDSLTVTVNINGSPRDIGVYCGNQKAPKLMSNDNYMEVTFISRTNQPKHRGFTADYEFVTDFGIKTGEPARDVVCGFIYNSSKSTNGSFRSPNFPGLYPRNTECHYLFYGAENEVIYITFPYFDVEGVPPMCADSTESDYVEFSNFNVKLTDRKMNRLCGTGNKLPAFRDGVTSDGNFFRVTFKSNDAYDKTGFDGFYQFRKKEDIYAVSKRMRDNVRKTPMTHASSSSSSSATPTTTTSSFLKFQSLFLFSFIACFTDAAATASMPPLRLP